MLDCTQHIGVLTIVIFIPESQSLKEKRMALRSMKDQIRNKFNVSIAELDDLDKWQLATFGMVMIGNDNRFIDECLQKIVSFIETFDTIQVSDYRITFL